MPNPFGQTAHIDKPYAVFKGYGDFEWRVLKTYLVPASEAKNPYAKWFVATRSPATFGEWEFGDVYKAEILKYGRLATCTLEWNHAYHGEH